MGQTFFGFGSLVNTATHNYGNPQAAQVTGWRRVWVGTTISDKAFLSVERADTTILGLTAEASDWAALDERETGYDRHLHNGTTIYAITPSIIEERAQPILLSYLDVVIQGFIRTHGPNAVQHFIDTTTGWNRPILNDRAKPLYPRAQVLTQDEQTAVDGLIAELRLNVS